MCRDNPHDALNYAPLTGATFEYIRKKVGLTPYPLLCRPYGTHGCENNVCGNSHNPHFAFNSLRDSPIAIFLPDTNDKNPFLSAPNIFYIVSISVQYQYSALHTRVFGLAHSGIRPCTLRYSARRLQYLRPKTATDHSTDGRGGCFGSRYKLLATGKNIFISQLTSFSSNVKVVLPMVKLRPW